MRTNSNLPKAWRDPGVWIIAATAVLLWWGGYPQPHIDDLFYTGAAVELARSGQLTNPWIAPWMESFGTDRFYAQPPVLPYLLGGWLFVFQVSAKSLTAFHLLAQAFVECSLYRFARRAGVAWFIALAPAVLAAFFLLSLGLRPEALGLSLVAASQLAFDYRSRQRLILSGTLAAAAVLTHPLLMSLVIPLYVWRGWEAVRGQAGRLFCLATATGILISSAAFALALRGEVSEFVRVMRAFSHQLTPSWHAAPAHFWGELTLGKQRYLLGASWCLIALGAIRTLFAAESAPHRSTLRDLWIVWVAATLFGLLLYPTRMVHYATAFGLALAMVSWGRVRLGGAFTLASLSLVALQSAALLLVPVFGSLKPPDAASLRAEIERHPDRKLCLDDVAARYLYDFKLPPGAVDWTQRQSATQGSRGTLVGKPAGELWIAAEWKLEHNIPDSGIRAERLRIGSKTVNSLAARPHRLALIE